MTEEQEPPILDTSVLRNMTFAHPDGIDILLATLAVSTLGFPPQVYNFDEKKDFEDPNVYSELAKGLHYAKRKSKTEPADTAECYIQRLANSEQLLRHKKRRSLIVLPFSLEDLKNSDELQRKDKIDPGEAACIVLAEKFEQQALFLSSDDKACRVAESLGIDYLTLPDILSLWVKKRKPSKKLKKEMLTGYSTVNFDLPDAVKELLSQ